MRKGARPRSVLAEGRAATQRCGGRARSRTAVATQRGGGISARVGPSRFYGFLEGLCRRAVVWLKDAPSRSGAAEGRASK